jgi:alkylation response protein AidB-like acyl-CoA dehydrogenase
MLDHYITTFNHVTLPSSALLGSLDKPASARANFLSVISRISVGTLAISSAMIPVLKRCAFVAGKYSLRRMIHGPDGRVPIPIISFRTQQIPILHTLAPIAVFDAWLLEATERFSDTGLEASVRHGIATCLKATVAKATQESLYTLAERCGAQGLYEHNHIIESQLECRGISISEGDVLTICIRE